MRTIHAEVSGPQQVFAGLRKAAGGAHRARARAKMLSLAKMPASITAIWKIQVFSTPVLRGRKSSGAAPLPPPGGPISPARR